MKFIVDKMPKRKHECPFSDWCPYPPIVEKTGDWICTKDKKICNLSEKECRWLKKHET